MNNAITYRPTQYPNQVRVLLNGKRTPYIVDKGSSGFYSLYWDSNPLLNYWTRDKGEMAQMVQEVVHKKCEPVKYQKLYYRPVE